MTKTEMDEYINTVVSSFIPVIDFTAKRKCKTCAYHTPSSPEEDEMTLLYWLEKPCPHQCHERRNGFACVGAMEACEKLGLMKRGVPNEKFNG